MIHFAVIVFSTAAACTALFLLHRLRNLIKAVAIISGAPSAPDDLGRELARLILKALDATILSEAGQAGLADVQISYREFQDPYRNLQELLDHVCKIVNSRGLSELNQLTKCLFQLQSTLGIPFVQLARSLRILEMRFTTSSGVTKAVVRVEIILPGALLDSKKMMAINHGTHVKQPLGVVTLGSDGKVVGKAKVICA